MQSGSSVEVAKVAFDTFAYLEKVWIKGDEYFISNPNDESWDLILLSDLNQVSEPEPEPEPEPETKTKK